MKRKKFLALALAGVLTAVTLTACTPLDAVELVYDWLFGGGSSSASRGNGTGLVESETLENGIIQWFGLPSANRQKDEAEPMLQEVAKSFDPESWYNNSGELNNTAKEALNKIAKDKLTITRISVQRWMYGRCSPVRQTLIFLRTDGFIMIGLLWAELAQILRLMPRVGRLTAG